MHESDESEDEAEMQLPSLFDGVTSLSEEEERTCALLEAMFKDTENEAYEAARVERDAVSEDNKCVYAYGEICIPAFVSMMREHIEAAPFSTQESARTFYDLGCGAGKAVIGVHCMVPEFDRCIGVEIVPALHLVAEGVAAQYRVSPLCPNPGEVAFLCGDALSGDTDIIEWDTADFVFSNCVTWPEEVLDRLYELATERLRSGAVLATVSRKMPEELVQRAWEWRWTLCDMTFGDCRVNVYTKA